MDTLEQKIEKGAAILRHRYVERDSFLSDSDLMDAADAVLGQVDHDDDAAAEEREALMSALEARFFEVPEPPAYHVRFGYYGPRGARHNNGTGSFHANLDEAREHVAQVQRGDYASIYGTRITNLRIEKVETVWSADKEAAFAAELGA
jgi:hypothetical protein